MHAGKQEKREMRGTPKKKRMSTYKERKSKGKGKDTFGRLGTSLSASEWTEKHRPKRQEKQSSKKLEKKSLSMLTWGSYMG